MSGDLYSSMPDTTSRLAPYRRSIRRLVASMLLFTSSLLLVSSMGLAQDDVSCEEFDSPEAAIEYAENNPDTETALDGDGNGIVCDEDPGFFTDDGDVEQRQEFADEIEDDAANGSDDSANQARQTPATGGLALLPLAGSALAAGCGGFMLLRRR